MDESNRIGLKPSTPTQTVRYWWEADWTRARTASNLWPLSDHGRPSSAMPTTLERRLISLLIRSNGFVEEILRQCARGNNA